MSAAGYAGLCVLWLSSAVITLAQRDGLSLAFWFPLEAGVAAYCAWKMLEKA